MGCFSFKCKKSKFSVLSDSFSGDAVHLFLLEKGKVIEHMFGNYDSYGRVFGVGEWTMQWNKVCDLMYDDDESNGICAILAPFWKEGDKYPTKRSKHDPNQGWGRRTPAQEQKLEFNGNDIQASIENPFHKVMY